MNQKIFSLLIGIDEYPAPNRLFGCVKDVAKVTNYLDDLGRNGVQIPLPITLLNRQATKANIVQSIKTISKQITDDDTFFIYYSGHGGQERTNGLFIEEHDGLLECLICYTDNFEEEGFLLADKELRYLFSTIETNPHLVTVFDCCHSGDMTRTLAPENFESGMRKRRIARSFEARKETSFIFKEEFSDLSIFKSTRLSEQIPNKNHIHLSAALSSESAWEDEQGGVFTRYLLGLLGQKNNAVSYYDIGRYAKISIRNITKVHQTPLVRVIGSGPMDQMSPWLGLEIDSTSSEAVIIYNKKDGWTFSQGALLGIREEMEIEITIPSHQTISAIITKALPEYALVDIPKEKLSAINKSNTYPAICKTTYSPLRIYINNLDEDPIVEKSLKDILANEDNIQEGNVENCNFEFSIFNQTLYLNYPGDHYRPLNEQLDLLDEHLILRDHVVNQIKYVKAWHHFNTLNNPGSFNKIPIAVNLDPEGNRNWEDTNYADHDIDLFPIERTDEENEWTAYFNLRITNTTNEDLFVACLALDSDFEIDSLIENHVIKLEPGQEVLLPENSDQATITLPSYKEVYNWKSNPVRLKFIVSNKEDFSTLLIDAQQPALPHPLIDTTGLATRSGARGSIKPRGIVRRKKEKWQVFTTTLNLLNPEYNMVSGHLDERWDLYIKNEKIGPFISKLYFRPKKAGFAIESEKLESAHGPAVASRGFRISKMDIANYLDDKLRYRRFRKAKKILPDAPTILAEGDSWFLYPFLVKDTLDYVMRTYPTRSLAAAGAELMEYKKSGQLLKEAKKLKPDYVLISGGGNDVIGPEVKVILKEGVGVGKEPEEYLLMNKYISVRKQLKKLFIFFFDALSKHVFIKHIFVHGYATIKAHHSDPTIIRNGWVNKYMIAAGMKDAHDRQRLIKFLVDNFNEDLETLADTYERVTYLDMRTLVLDNEWYDEIHPSDEGFKKIGDRFIEAIKAKETNNS
ncbi:MAG: hypothetical protein HKN09_03820 [Saprospiraceae bacterium]|nr:hypothetical protein [Saprospiraceae bacterium]